MPLRFQSAHPNITMLNIMKSKAMEVMDINKSKVMEVTSNKNKVMVAMNNMDINKRATDTHTRLHHHTLTHPAEDHLMNLMDIITKPNDATQFVGFMIALHAYILPNIDSRRSKLIHMTL